MVVGGSIAGLSAARVLQRLDIETLALGKTDCAMRDRGAGIRLEPALVAAVLGRDPGAELPQARLRGRALRGGWAGAGGSVIQRGEHRVTTWQHLCAVLGQGLGVPVVTHAEVCGVVPRGVRWEVLRRLGERHWAIWSLVPTAIARR